MAYVLGLPVVLGLAAALLWGTADFFAKGVAERDSGHVALLWLYWVGLPLYVAIWLWRGGEFGTADTTALWVLAGILNAGGYLFLYRGFEVGLLAVVSTTNAMWAAIAVLLSMIFLGEVPTAITGFGVLLTLTGVVLISYSGSEWKMGAPGFLEGCASAVLFGVSFFLLKIPLAQGDAISQAVVMRAVGLVMVGAFVLWRSPSSIRFFFKRPPLFPFIDSFGFLAFITGLSIGAAYIVAPLGSLLTPVAVGLAALFLHERLERHQWIGFVLVVIGGLILS